MAQNPAPGSHCWSYHPVDPLEFHCRLTAALGVLADGLDPSPATPVQLVALPFPDVKTPAFRERYLLREVLRKYPSFDLGIDTRKAALDTFLKGEEVNRASNERLHTATPDSLRARRILRAAACKIGAVLGRFDWSDFWEGWRFGPGATVTVSSEKATVFRKLSTLPACTRSAGRFYRQLIRLNPMWATAAGLLDDTGEPIDPSWVDWDLYNSVPKNAKTDRSIGIPPDINVALQLAVGRMLRGRLHRCGVDLSDQSVNQRLARIGSESGALATVDLANASGSISIALVWLLFGSNPDEIQDRTWLWVMDALRTEYTLVGDKDTGTLHRNELFSAMGNGFTFELESLIFWAIARAVCSDLGLPKDSIVSVYGDDIVLPVAAYDLLREVLSYAGFDTNVDKTFASTDGPLFRESCGEHYLDGSDVSPFYVDSSLDKPESIVLLANNLHRWAVKPDGTRDGRVYSVWIWVLSHLDPRWADRCIPMGAEDDGIILSRDECEPTPLFSGVYPKTFYAFKVPTAEIRHRPWAVNDEERYIEWHYLRRVVRFKPPNRLLGATPLHRFWSPTRGYVFTWYPGEDPVRDLSLPTRAGRVTSLWLAKRRAVDWAMLGPWVDETSFIDVSRAGIRNLWRAFWGSREETGRLKVHITSR